MNQLEEKIKDFFMIKGLESIDTSVSELINFITESALLPSRFKDGDKVDIQLGDYGVWVGAEVTAIKFKQGKVFYDVALTIRKERPDTTELGVGVLPEEYTIIEGIDSALVEPMYHSIKQS